jgi:uncharacterized protein with PIN domain
MAAATTGPRKPGRAVENASTCDCTSRTQKASLRFYAELNDFLPPERRGRSVEYSFYVSPSVKDAIESLGVPHTEVDLVLVNGASVDFTHLLKDGDRVSVYPVFESIDISPVLKVRPKPLREPRFVADGHLGRLAAYLRLLGFDTSYRKEASDDELARISREQHRILLTRDRGLLKRGAVTHGYYVRHTDPRLQLREVVDRFDLAGRAAPFSRCLRCNAPLAEAGEADLAGRLPSRVRELHDRFWTCPQCRRVYWEGSHHRRMRQLLTLVLPGRPPSEPRPA